MRYGRTVKEAVFVSAGICALLLIATALMSSDPGIELDGYLSFMTRAWKRISF